MNLGMGAQKIDQCYAQITYVSDGFTGGSTEPGQTGICSMIGSNGLNGQTHEPDMSHREGYTRP